MYVRSLKQERHRLVTQMRALGRSHVEVAEEIRRRYNVNARVALRWARGWSQGDAADEWSRIWPDDIKAAKNFSYWETWPHSGHAPSLVVLDRLARLYQCDVADLLADLPGYRHLDDEAAPDADAVPPPAVDGEPRASRAAAPRALDILAIEAMSAAFRAADRRLGGGILYGPVVRYLNHEVAPHLLPTTEHSPEPTLFSAAASLTEAAGWMARDGGDDREARRHLVRAYRLAAAARDRPLMANVCASMAHLAHHCGEASEAIRLADLGIEHVRDYRAAGRLTARLLSMRVLGLARAGHAADCLTALGHAERCLGSLDRESPAWVTPFDEGSLAGEAAAALHLLGDVKAAERQARRAIELRGGDRVRSRALAQMTLAHVLVDAGRVDEAADLGLTACEAARTLASAQVRRSLSRLAESLRPHASLAAVALFLDTLDTADRASPGDDGPVPWPT